MPSEVPEASAPEAGSHGLPIANWFDFDARSLIAPYQYVIAPDTHLEWSAQEPTPDHDTLGSFGKTHICQTPADFLAKGHPQNLERGSNWSI